MPIDAIERFRGVASRFLRRPSAGALVLLYHRVNAAPGDPWSLNVSPQNFAAHLQVLRRMARPTSLQDLSTALREGGRLSRRVAVTFDDGYLDNLTHAKPLLERFEIPATVFMAGGYLDQPREFWWDELEHLLLHPGRLPDVLTLTIGGQRHAWPLGVAADYTADEHLRHRAWLAGGDDVPTARHRAYVELHRLLGVLTELERRPLMDQLIDQRMGSRGGDSTPHPPPVRDGYRPLTSVELMAIDQSRWMTVGAHTLTHPMLDLMPVDKQREDIHAGKVVLEALLQRPVTAFAYPYGRHLEATPGLVQALGFDCACSVQPGAVRADSDPYRINRAVVCNWSGEEFAHRLATWMDAV